MVKPNSCPPTQASNPSPTIPHRCGFWWRVFFHSTCLTYPSTHAPTHAPHTPRSLTIHPYIILISDTVIMSLITFNETFFASIPHATSIRCSVFAIIELRNG
ncbi:hypothetical protein Hdeb2414_s0167g00820961 [Helianthus debilis subsp. tardiflorus]